MMKIKTVVGACAFAGALFAVTTPAGAAGPPVDRFDGIYATCDGLGEVFVVTLPAHAELTPGFVLDSGTVLVPFETEVVATFTPTGGTPEVSTMVTARRAPKKATVTICHGHGSFTTADGTMQFDLTAHVVAHP